VMFALTIGPVVALCLAFADRIGSEQATVLDSQ